MTQRHEKKSSKLPSKTMSVHGCVREVRYTLTQAYTKACQSSIEAIMIDCVEVLYGTGKEKRKKQKAKYQICVELTSFINSFYSIMFYTTIRSHSTLCGFYPTVALTH